MRKLWLIVPLLLVVAACSKSSTSSSPSPSTAITSASPAASAAAGTTVKVANSASMGKILTNAAGMTLYTSSKDTTGTSNCTGGCATAWPPLAFTGSGTPTGTTDLSVITRADGTKQVAYKGKPLYTFASDTKPGDTTGEGVGGFSVAKVT